MAEFKNIVLNARLDGYIRAHAEPRLPAQAELEAKTTALGEVAEMQIPHEQGVLLTMLVRILQARTVVEIGTFTGYAALAMALGLPEGGKVITLDRSTEWLEVATRAWQDAGVEKSIEFRLGLALDSLRAMPAKPEIDLVFIDADKTGYRDYWEEVVPRVRPGGLILADNVLYYGEVVADDASENGRAIREFNEHVRADNRTESVMLPIADGLTIARRRA
ncbi:MAG: O-methyltransferase [Catenulispora sp.]